MDSTKVHELVTTATIAIVGLISLLVVMLIVSKIKGPETTGAASKPKSVTFSKVGIITVCLLALAGFYFSNTLTDKSSTKQLTNDYNPREEYLRTPKKRVQLRQFLWRSYAIAGFPMGRVDKFTFNRSTNGFDWRQEFNGKTVKQRQNIAIAEAKTLYEDALNTFPEYRFCLDLRNLITPDTVPNMSHEEALKLSERFNRAWNIHKHNRR